jgi:hypothetical protein
MFKKPLPTPATPVYRMSTSVYDGTELHPFTGRAGSLDAFRLPSLTGDKRTQPRHHAVELVAQVPEAAGTAPANTGSSNSLESHRAAHQRRAAQTIST